MRRLNKHNSQSITFSSLVGGINISQAPEQIDLSELQEAQNFIYARDSKRLTGRAGLGLLYTMSDDEGIRDMWYDVDTNLLLCFTNKNRAYRYIIGQEPEVMNRRALNLWIKYGLLVAVNCNTTTTLKTVRCKRYHPARRVILYFCDLPV